MSNKEEYFIIGKRSVIEALRVHYPIRVVIFERGVTRDEVVKGIYNHAKKQDIQILERDSRWFERRFRSLNPQGVVAVGLPYVYAGLEELTIKSNSIFLILDRIQDPQNLGAIIRSAECSGVQGIIIPEKESVGVTESVMSISSGAVFHVKIVKVPNLLYAVRYLKERKVWVIGTQPNASASYYEIDFRKVPFAVVIGNEGEGIRQGIIKECDYVVSIPMRGRVNSLNASVATGILLFKIIEAKSTNGEL